MAVFLPYRFLRERRRVDRQITGLRDELSGHNRRITRTEQANASAREEAATMGERVVDIEKRLKPSGFAAAKPEDPRRLELPTRDATAALRLSSEADEDG